jgi:hypothetical protein
MALEAMIHSGYRAAGFATLALALLGAASSHAAAAASFADSCAAGTGGIFEVKDCSCLDTNITDQDDKKSMMAYFEINAEMARTHQAPTAGDAADKMTKGVQLIAKYLPQCMK